MAMLKFILAITLVAIMARKANLKNFAMAIGVINMALLGIQSRSIKNRSLVLD